MKIYPNKFFGSNMQGAPQVSEDSAQGQISALLKAVLVDGFGTLVPDSIVFDSDTSLAKASFSSGHAYEKDSVLLFEGVTPADYNGEHRVISVTSTAVYFELDDDVTPISATVIGTVKVAPLGWSISFSDASNEIIIFTAEGDLGNVHLRIDNSAFDSWSGSYARLCKVSIVENVVDINSYDEIFTHYWPATARYSSKNWNLAGNNKIFFFMMQYGAKNNFGGFVAGYIDTIRAGDRYHFILNHLASSSNAERWDQINSSYNYYTNLTSNIYTDQRVIARKYHQLEGVDSWSKKGMGKYGSDVMPLPNPVDNGFYNNTTPQMLQESAGEYRGTLPMMVEPLSNYTALHGKVLSDIVNLTGKKIVYFKCSNHISSSISDSLIGFDVSTVEV